MNGAELLRWAKKQGFGSTLDKSDLHVTVAYSKAKLHWPPADRDSITIPEPSRFLKREVKPLGDEGAVVLAFDSTELYRRWRSLVDYGASWDYATYTPHVTITYDGKGMDLSKVEPFAGAIVLGPERFEAIEDDRTFAEKETA